MTMADQADQASALEQAEWDEALRRHRQRAGAQPFRDTLPRGFDVGQRGDEVMVQAMAHEAEGE
jgi:hypothetical protein